MFDEFLSQNSNTEDKKCQECKNLCIKELYSILDGEATLEQTQKFQQHIQQCMPCYSHYDLEVAIKELLRKRLEKKCVPDSLISEIRVKVGLITQDL